MSERCPYIESSGEGTNYCRLADINVEEIDSLKRALRLCYQALNEVWEVCERRHEKSVEAALEAIYELNMDKHRQC